MQVNKPISPSPQGETTEIDPNSFLGKSVTEQDRVNANAADKRKSRMKFDEKDPETGKLLTYKQLDAKYGPESQIDTLDMTPLEERNGLGHTENQIMRPDDNLFQTGDKKAAGQENDKDKPQGPKASSAAQMTLTETDKAYNA